MVAVPQVQSDPQHELATHRDFNTICQSVCERIEGCTTSVNEKSENIQYAADLSCSLNKCHPQSKNESEEFSMSSFRAEK